MDLSELEVPEPQPGVAPGGPNGTPNSAGRYPPPPVAPPKVPNMFERVFLGKKMPPAPPAPQPRAPAMPTPQIRPGQPNGVSSRAQPSVNYRPFQSGQPAQPGQPTSPGSNGPRPGIANPQAVTAQPNGDPQQVFPVQLQRPVGQPQVIPPQPYDRLQSQPPQQLPQRPDVSPQQIQIPPQYNPQQSANGSPQVVPSQVPTEPDEVPLLSEEPEESLEIDLNPKAISQPLEGAIPAVRPSGADLTPAPVSSGTSDSGPTKSAKETDPAPSEASPFSGLRLNIPESAESEPAAISAPPADPALTPTPSAAASATLPSKPSLTPVPTSEDPFLDDEVPIANAKPVKGSDQSVTPPVDKVTGPPANIKHSEISPLLPPGKAASPTSQPAATPVAKISEQSPPKSAADERLKKLTEAPEKTGLKGFCPVALRQKGQLIEAKPQFNTTYQGKKYQFSTMAAKAAFEAEPQLFAPVHSGLDGVALLDHEKSVPGSLDHAVWYQGHLYLFASRENRETFVNAPDEYLNETESEPTVFKTITPPAKPAPQQQPMPAAKAAPQAVVLPNELPVLSDNLDDLPPQLPVTSKTLQPAAKTPAAQTPALLPMDTGKTRSTTWEAPAGPVVPKPKAQPAIKPSGAQPGPQLESPLLKKATRTTPASFVVPSPQTAQQRVPPRLISPDLRLAPRQ